MLDLQRTLSSFQKDADWVSLRHVREKTTYRTIRDEKPDRNNISFDQGVMVEVLVNGHFGFAGTSDLSSDGIRRAFMKATSLSAFCGHAQSPQFFFGTKTPGAR